MLEDFASAKEFNDKVLEKLETTSKKVILLFNYSLLNKFAVTFLASFNKKIIVS